MQCAESGMQVYDLSADSFCSFRGPVACAISQADLTKDGKRLAWLTVGSDGESRLPACARGSGTLRGTLHAWSSLLPSQFVHRCPKASTGRAELVLLHFDRDCFRITANDAAAHHQL